MSTSALPGRRRSSAAPSLLLAAVPAAVGVLLVLIGWISVSGAAAFDDQTAPLNVSIAGAVVVFLGCGFYLWAFRRRLGQRLEALRAANREDGDEE